jgi:hypothetical protein
MVTVNALRRYLNGSGCVEVRVFEMAGLERQSIEFRCQMKSGKSCRAVFTTERGVPEVPAIALMRIEQALAPCLGRGWSARIPVEDPFG